MPLLATAIGIGGGLSLPLQTSPGIETIETKASQLEVVQNCSGRIDHSIQVRPVIYMTQNCRLFLTPMLRAYPHTGLRWASFLRGIPVRSLPHEKIHFEH